MAHDELAQLIDYLRSPSGRALDHAALEVAINDRGRELLRVLMQAQIDSRGQGAAVGPVQGADAVARGQQRLHQRGLSTMFGQIRLKRLGYGATGVESLHPLDAELNLPKEQYSLGVRRLAAQNAAQVSFDATVEMLAERTGQTIGKRQVEQLVQRAAKDFDAYYARQRPATAAASRWETSRQTHGDGGGGLKEPRPFKILHAKLTGGDGALSGLRFIPGAPQLTMSSTGAAFRHKVL